MLKDLLSIKPQTWAMAAGLVLAAFLTSRILGKREKLTTKKLTYGSLCIAIAFVLSYIRFVHLPQGGSITPGSMLPIMFFAFAFGPVEGIAAGMVYGLLQYVQDAYYVHWIQLLFDYPMAFGALGIAGYFKKNFALGVVSAGLGRFIFHFLSGVIFFASYAPKGMNPVLYSIVYNGSVVGPDLIICLIIIFVPQFKNAIYKIKSEAAA